MRICLGCFINVVNGWKPREWKRLCSEAVLCSLLLGYSLVLRWKWQFLLISHDSRAVHGSLQSMAVVPIRMNTSVRACGSAVPWDRSSPAHGAVVPVARANRGCYAVNQVLQPFGMHHGNVFQLCTARMGVQSFWSICCQINVQSWLLDSGLSQGAAWVTARGKNREMWISCTVALED